MKNLQERVEEAERQVELTKNRVQAVKSLHGDKKHPPWEVAEYKRVVREAKNAKARLEKAKRLLQECKNEHEEIIRPATKNDIHARHVDPSTEALERLVWR